MQISVKSDVFNTNIQELLTLMKQRKGTNIVTNLRMLSMLSKLFFEHMHSTDTHVRKNLKFPTHIFWELLT